MDRVSSANFQTISGRRTWQNMNLGAAIQGTTFDQLWFAGVQESIIALAEQVGITPADATLGNVDLQALQGVRRIAGGNVTVISAATATLTADNAGLVLVNAVSNNVAITYPAVNSANGQALRFRFSRIDRSGNTATIAPAGSDLWEPGAIGGLYTIAPGERLDTEGDGISNWEILDCAGGGETFTSSGTAVVPTGHTAATVEVWGGGGGSGGCGGTTYNCGSTGSGGGYARLDIQGLVADASIPITIGAGGNGGIGNTVSPTAGGTSSFGSYVSATGGGPGANGLAGSPGSSVGAPGAGSGGDINLTGGNGGIFWFSGSTGAVVAAAPGAAPGMPSQQPSTADANGGNAINYGGAGGAGVTLSGAFRNGGNGSGGLVVVRWRR